MFQTEFYSKNWIWLIPFLLFISPSCSFFEGESIAKCDGNVLFQEDYLNYLEAFELVDEEDVKSDFIDKWINACLIKKEIKSINEKEYFKNKFRSEEFFMDKNLFELENSYINNHLDTLVTEKQIIEHYRSNRSNYVRQSFIVKALYIKVEDSIAENEQIETAFLLKNDKDRDNINKYGNLYGLSFYWEEDKWIFLDDLIREIPITERVKEDIVVKRGEGIFKDEQYRFYLNIFDYRIKESKEPLTFERKEIRNHILKRRVNALREEANKKIIKELYEKYDFSINN
jgi:hypothetical protein